MDKISDLQFEQYPHDRVVMVSRRSEDKKSQDSKKSVEDTKRKIRAAFTGSEKVKASLRP